MLMLGLIIVFRFSFIHEIGSPIFIYSLILIT
jgi:hypothetical protein